MEKPEMKTGQRLMSKKRKLCFDKCVQLICMKWN